MLIRIPKTQTALAPHIHLAWRGADVVALDLFNDSYACLVDAAAVLQAGDAAGTVRAEDGDILQELSRAGWLTDNDPSHHPRIPAVGVLRPIPAAGPILPFGALISGLRSTIQFKGARLDALVRRVAERNARLGYAADRLVAAQVLGAFEAVQPWLPYAGDCLQRAYMLHACLHASGVAADWMFGVRTWPFMAHCWIQIGDEVVGETLERAHAFTPILRVR